jgi:membrane protein DedA with SNARE-associated domain
LIIASAYAGTGKLSIRDVILFAAVAAIVGDAAGYWLGRTIGRDVARFFRVKEKNVKRIETFFKKHGPKTVFFGRFISILRTYSALFAGISHMSYPKFTAYNAAGGILWATAFGVIGYLFGKNLHHLESVLHEVNLFVLISVILLILLVLFARKLRARYRPG